ncbi:MAG: BatD family protein [Gemmatimonadaceae bacterium]
MLAALAIVAQLAVTATAPDSIALDGVAAVRVRVTSDRNAARLVTPSFRPFVVVRSALSQSSESRRGASRYVADYEYTLAPTKAGVFRFGPFVATDDRATARGAAIRIVVRGNATAGGARPLIVKDPRLDTGAVVNFRALVAPETVYVGEQATYQLGVFLDASVRDRVRKMEAIAPEMRGVLAYDPPQPLQVFQTRAAGGRPLEVHVYQRAVFPLSPGRVAIPPARLIYALPLSYSFFSREESYDLRSDSAFLVAVEPPVANRPAGFTGAVGQLRASAKLDAAGARVGNPFSVVVTIAGTGNVKLLPRPELRVPWASAVPGDERVVLDRSPLVIGGSKSFEWLLTPERSGVLVLPPVRYPYFSPQTERYEIAQTAPETLTVAAGALAAADRSAAGDTMGVLTLRAEYRGPLPRPFYERRTFWWLLALAPLPALTLVSARRPERRRARRSAAQHLRHLARAGGSADTREVRRVLVAAVAERLGISAPRAGSAAELARELRRGGVTPATAVALGALVGELEASVFSGAPAPARDFAARGAELYSAIEREARPRRAANLLPPTAVAFVIALASVGALWAAAPGALEFQTGVRAYEARRYAVAAGAFERSGQLDPRAPDAWANLGTAAWAMHDTARAALGWHRAVRLEPLARDVRHRIGLLGTSGSDASRPLPVPPVALMLAAAALWVGAWSHVAFRALRRRPQSSGLVSAIVALALVFAGAGRALDATLAGRDLAVVARTSALRTDPALNADSTAAVRTGEITRVIERKGGWARVSRDGLGDGWLPGSYLLPIASD